MTKADLARLISLVFRLNRAGSIAEIVPQSSTYSRSVPEDVAPAAPAASPRLKVMKASARTARDARRIARSRPLSQCI